MFSDSTKWTSSYNIWDYFGLANNVGHGNIVRFSKRLFSVDNGFTGSETTDNAIDIEFYLAVNDSPSEKCTLPAVYSVLTSFGNQRNNPFINKVQQHQIAKTGEQPTLTSYTETRTDLVFSLPTTITAFSLDSIDTFKKVYDITAVPTNESYSLINTTTASGLISTQRKAMTSIANNSLASDIFNPVVNTESPLSSFVCRLVSIYYWAEQPFSFPISGTINNSGTLFIDGVNLGFLNTNPASSPTTLSLLTLDPNEDLHTAKLQTSSAGGTGGTFEISLEFQYRLYRKY